MSSRGTDRQVRIARLDGSKSRRLAIVPARSGSKGVPRKNMQEIGGETLIARAVRVARETDLFDTILVSTDAPDFAEEGKRAGAEVPFLRPAELAGDKAVVLDVLRHVLDELAAAGREFDLLALLEPTSPLRSAVIVREVVTAAEAEGWDAAFSVSLVPPQMHPAKQFRIDPGGGAHLFLEHADEVTNRQQLTRTYVRNGMCYAVRAGVFLETGKLFGQRARAIVVEQPYVSIDAPEDLERANAMIESESRG